jgi:PAS domain S-box-containing protein
MLKNDKNNARSDSSATLAELVKEAIVVVDENARITYWNPAAEKIFGYTSQEALGKNIHGLVVPASFCKEGKERIALSVNTFSQTGMGYFTVGNVELIGRRKDRSEFPVELSISPRKIEGKWAAVATVKDITSRKRAENSLREAEQRYHTLFNQAPLGVLVINPETAEFVEFNDVAHSQLGYTREEFEKTKIFDIEAKESEEETRVHLQRMLNEGGGEFETLQRTKTGQTKNVLVTTRTFRSADKIFLHTIFHDITETKKIQNSLAESETRYRQLVQLAHEGIWAIDNDYRTVFVNPRMAQMLGYPESEMLGRELFDFLDPPIIEKVRGVIEQFKLTHTTDEPIEYAFPRKDGTRIYTNITLSIIHDDDDREVRGLLAVMSDITARKQAEKALKESEAFSKTIVANAPIGIATSNAAHRFLSANEAFCRILGYTEDELKKLSFKELTYSDDLSESFTKMAALREGKINYFELEKRYVRKDGTIIIGRVMTNAIRDQTNQPILYIAELEDITKSKKLEEDLSSSEERFRAISTSAMDAIILSDSEDQVIYWNPAAEKIFGYTQNEVIGRKLADLVIPSYGKDNHQCLLEQLSKGMLPKKHFGFKALKKDGGLFPMDLAVVSVKLKDKDCLLSIVRDITEWKNMENALKQERDMLETMATNIDAGLAIIDRDYHVLWTNQRLKQVNHNESTEGKLCYSVLTRDSNGVCPDCGVKKIFEGAVEMDRHDSFVKNGDSGRWIEIIATPVKDKDGNVVAALELAVDITERKSLQNKLSEYSQRLEELVQQRTEQLKKTQAELVRSERLAAIGELAGMIGHDLRNPLTGIKNSAYYLKKKSSSISQEQAQEMLETIDKCVDYSNKIINDLLDYSRDVHLEVKTISPRKLLADSLGLLLVPEGIETQNLLSDEPALTVDVDKVKRVFTNLIKNAVDAMPKGGKITVTGKQVGDFTEVSFSDTGVGVPDDVLPKLFSPLFTTKAQGMGFGLAICKRIVEAHGGAITVKTVKGQGTTFALTLPIKFEEVGGERYG